MPIARGPTLGDQVYAYIRERVVSGYYRPGQIIVESELAESLNVSRTPVSNAVIMLKERGLIEERNGKYFTLDLTVGDVVDLYQCRLAFDGLAARLASPRITATQLEELERLLDVWRRPGTEVDAYAMASADLAFHSLVYEASGNKHLIRFCEIATDLLATYRRVILDNLSRDHRASRSHLSVGSEHARIIAGLASRDPVIAEEAARAHMNNVVAYVEQVRQSLVPPLDMSIVQNAQGA